MRTKTITITAVCIALLSLNSVPAAAQAKKKAPCQAKAFSTLLESINRGKAAKVNASTIAAGNYMYASAKRLRAQKRLGMCQNALQSGNYLLNMALRIKKVASAPKPAVKRPGTLLTGPARLGKGKIIAKASQIKHGQSFGYSFWIKPTKSAQDWTAIFQKGSKNTMRGPGVFFMPKSTRLHARSATKRAWNDGCNAKSNLVVNKWSHVYVRFAPGFAWVYINGKGDNRCKIGQKLLLNNAPLYLGSPWYKPANANIRNLRYHNGRLTIQQIRQVMGNKL